MNCNGVAIILPLPSDPKYAETLNLALKAVQQFGMQLYAWADSNLLSLEEWIDLHMPVIDRDCGWSDVVGCVQNVLYLPLWAAAQLGKGMIEVARKIICGFAKSTVTNAGCDPLTVFAISGAKAIWQIIKKGTYGSNTWILSQFTLNIDINIIDKTFQYLEAAVCPMGLPEIHHALHCNLNNKISDDAYTFIARTHGWHPKFSEAFRASSREQLRGWEPIEWIRRQSLGNTAVWNPQSPFVNNEQQTEEAWRKDSEVALRNIGWIYQTDADQFIDVYDELPTIAQHLHWLARNVDDASYVAEYNLLDGFSTDADCGTLLGGIPYQRQPQVGNRNFWATFGPELRAQGMRKIDAAREYAAHWLHAAPVQLQHFMWRLRDGRVLKDWELGVAAQMGWPVGAGNTAPSQMVFTTHDYQRILAEQDYAPVDVGWFASTMFQVPALGYLRDMYRYSIIDETDLKGYHQDLGYSTQDSERFVAVDQKIKHRIRSMEAHGWTPIALSNAYALGMITPEQDSQWMTYLGFTNDEIQNHQNAADYQLRTSLLRRAMSYSISRLLNSVLGAYREGLSSADSASSALSNLGIPKERITAMLSTVDTTRLTAIARNTTASIKKAYMRGSVTESDAKQLLSGYLQNTDVVETTVDSWTVQRFANESAPTKAEIRRYLKEGLITPDEASVRLTNLGMKADNVDLLLAEYQYLMDQSEKKLEAKEKSAQEKANLAAQKQAARQLAEEQKAAATAAHQAAVLTEREQVAATRAETRAAALAYWEEVAAQRVLTQQQARQSRALLAAAREAEQMQARIVAALKKDEPPAKLAKWAQLGLIDQSYFTQRMSLYGFTEESIQRQWETACAASTATCVPDAAGQPGIGTAADAAAAAAVTTAAVTAEWAGVTAAETAAQNSGR